MPEAKDYNLDYFEKGVISGRSGYMNYQWLPELTIKLAFNIIKHLGLKEDEKILDYGCAKGYLVKAMRILDIDAYGADISEYAINFADAEVRKYCSLITPENSIIGEEKFDWIMSKDVLEHISEPDLDIFLKKIRSSAKKTFHIIPLGDDNGKFIIPEYENDVTHITIKPVDWWIKKFEEHGWKLKKFDYKVRGIKENWTSCYDKGNGCFIFE